MTKVIELDEDSQDVVIEQKEQQHVNESKKTWKPYHLFMCVFTKFVVNTIRRFGYTYSPALSRLVFYIERFDLPHI